jgi:hypothetical protein
MGQFPLNVTGAAPIDAVARNKFLNSVRQDSCRTGEKSAAARSQSPDAYLQEYPQIASFFTQL